MKQYIKTLWSNIPYSRKLATVLFIQIWIWPQTFSVNMEPGIALSTFITCVCSIMTNFIAWIHAKEKE